MDAWFNPDGTFPILSAITYLPLFGALFVMIALRSHQTRAIKVVANVIAIADLLLSIRSRCMPGSRTFPA